MTTQHGCKRPSKGTVVETPFDGLDDDLISDQGEADFAPFLHVHGGGEVSGKENAETPTDALHPSSQCHDRSLMCI